MKIITLVSTGTLDKDGKLVTTPPGVVDFDDETANDLLDRGFAKTIAEATAEAETAAGGVKVQTQGKGPKVKAQ